jgi:hypothetical protein
MSALRSKYGMACFKMQTTQELYTNLPLV